jgi:DNA-binding GntR family transcriptional regulator
MPQHPYQFRAWRRAICFVRLRYGEDLTFVLEKKLLALIEELNSPNFEGSKILHFLKEMKIDIFAFVQFLED